MLLSVAILLGALHRLSNFVLSTVSTQLLVPYTIVPLTSVESFDREILRAFARTNYLGRCAFGRKRLSFEQTTQYEFLAKYLLQRPHTKDTPTQITVAAVFHDIVEEITRYDPDRISAQIHYQYLRDLCAGLGSQRVITHDGGIMTTSLVSDIEKRYHIVTGAIYLGKLSVADRILEDKQMDVAQVKSEIFGTPLQAAVRMGHHDFVRVLLKRGANINMGDSIGRCEHFQKAIYNHDEKMIRLLLEPQYGYATHGRHFEDDIILSLRINQANIAHLILERHESKLSECPEILKCGLPAACRYGMIEIVRLLLDQGANVNERSSDGTLIGTVELAAWTGQEEVLLLLLARGADPYGYGSGNGSMCAAAWGGHTGVARILLDAGIELTPRRWENVLVRAAPRPGSLGIVRLILERGLVDFNTLDDDYQKLDDGTFDTHSSSNGSQVTKGVFTEFEALACVHGNVGFIQALGQHSADIGDVALFARENLPPPIVIAMAFRQNHVVAALRELGVMDVDPLEGVMGDKFADGTWPCDPPSPPYCEMPYKV